MGVSLTWVEVIGGWGWEVGGWGLGVDSPGLGMLYRTMLSPIPECSNVNSVFGLGDAGLRFPGRVGVGLQRTWQRRATEWVERGMKLLNCNRGYIKHEIYFIPAKTHTHGNNYSGMRY